MNITETILEGIKKAIHEGGKQTIDLREASNLTGSGSGIGGNVIFDDAFAALRSANPLRQGSRQITVSGSDVQFVAKTCLLYTSVMPLTQQILGLMLLCLTLVRPMWTQRFGNCLCV